MSNVASFRTPSYRRHKATGQAVVTINGHDIYLGKYGTEASHEAYRRHIAEYMLTASAPARENEVTVSDVMAAYLDHAQAYYRKNGVVTREFGLIVEACRFVRRLYGRAPATQFGPLALKAVRNAMIEAEHSRKYINKNVERIRRMFKWAAAEELIPATVPQALSMVVGLRQGRSEARETPPILPVDEEVLERTLLYLPAMVADMVRLQRLTGARPAEVCSLRPERLDRSGSVWIYRPEGHKTQHQGRDRVVLIGPRAQEILNKYLDRAPSSHCFQPKESELQRQLGRAQKRKTTMSCGNIPGANRVSRPRRVAGDSYTTDSYRRAIHRACDRAFLHPEFASITNATLTEAQRAELNHWQTKHRWSPNQVRHAAATEVRRRFGLEAAQVVLGHQSADVTQVYAERDLAKGIEVAKAIG